MSTKKEIENDFISADEVAELTGYSLQTLANMRSRKKRLPFYKQGGSIWYKKSEVLESINNSRVSVTK